MSKYRSYLKRLKCFGNILFIAIGLTLFILNIIRYSTVYLQRENYELNETSPGSFYILKQENTPVELLSSSNPPYQYSEFNAKNILQWFIQSSTKENRAFHIFYWFMIIFAFIISIIPSIIYVGHYCISDHYKIIERYCLSNTNLFIRTFFSITIFILPSFHMYTFDFSNSPYLNIYPPTLSINMLLFVFITFICLSIYFLFYCILNSCYAKHRFCCSVQFISYVGFCLLGLLITGIVLYSATIIIYILIVSFMEEALRLAAILIVIQFPFLIVQLLSD